MRSRESIIIGVVLLLLFVGGCAGCGVRNRLVSADEAVKAEWANVQSAYQRRADLIPNLVRSVERAEALDSDLVASLSGVNSRATALRLSSDDLDDANRMNEFGSLQRELGQSLSELLDSAGRSESLRSVEAFRDLQDQIEGSENRINFARRDYNEAVRAYNRRVRRFPTSLVAVLTGFSVRPTFQADEGADEPPSLE